MSVLIKYSTKAQFVGVVWANDQHCHLFQERALLDTK